MTVTAAQHRQALAIRCEACGAGPGLRCAGITRAENGHASRFHDFAARSKPEPDAACVAALTERAGTRADARAFVAWMTGGYTFRAPGSTTGSNAIFNVYNATGTPVSHVRRELVERAARHGLVALAGTGPRGAYAVTQRGLDFHARRHTVADGASPLL